MVDKPKNPDKEKKSPLLWHRTKEHVLMDFWKIFIGRSIKEILHLLPKDERKDAKKESFQELIDDCLRYAVEWKSNHDWKKLFKDDPRFEALVERYKELHKMTHSEE